jgi:hypothetical protein
MATGKEMSREMSELMEDVKDEHERLRHAKGGLKASEEILRKKCRELEALEKKEKYFIYGPDSYDLYLKPENEEKFRELYKYLPDQTIRFRRFVLIILTFGEFTKRHNLIGVCKLDGRILNRIIDCYMEDVTILKKRCGYETIQLPKVAGLMTNLIVKYRPVVSIESGQDPNNPRLDINETFAIYHALCICSDFSNGEELESFENASYKNGEDEISIYDDFFENMKFLLKRNFTPESLIMTFRALCLCYFKSFLTVEVDG